MRTILLYLFITCSLYGISAEQNTERKVLNKLSTSLDLIEKNKVEEAEIIIREYIENQPSINEKAETCFEIAKAYNNSLFYNMSIEYALEGINYLDTNLILISKLYSVIIINHIDLKNYNIAENYYWKLAKIETNQPSIKSSQYNIIGELYRLQGFNKKAIPFYRKAIKINIDNSFKNWLIVSYNNIGLSLLELNNIDSASYYLNKSLNLINELNSTHRASAINISFGDLYLKKGDYKKALLSYSKTITFDISQHPDQFELYQDAYKGMSNCYKLMGDYKNALSSYIEYQKYNVKILDYKKNTSILQKQILSERKVHLKELSLINSKLQLEIKYKRVMILVLVAIVFIIFLIIYILRIRNNRIKQKIELEINKNRIQELELDKLKLTQGQLESELIQNKQSEEIKKLERTRLEEQVQSQNRELTSTAIHMMSKNEILNQIQEKLSQVKNDNLTLKTFKEIDFLISDSLRLDEDWEVFKKHFTDVHPLFFEKLKTEYPDLTTDELKLCAYLKIRLSSKEIARLIYITVAAVNKRRNRLRKKLNISADEDFDVFFIRHKALN